MNSNDFDDIFLENEKTSFQKDFGDMTDDPNHERINHSGQVHENFEDRPHAFPQNTFNLFSGNLAQHYSQAPEWYTRHKKLPGLSGFVTLGMPMAFDNNNEQLPNIPELEKMDIQSLIQQDFNFNLGKIFDENSASHYARRDSGIGLGLEGIPGPGGPNPHGKQFHKHPHGTKKHSKSNEKIFDYHAGGIHGDKMSFFQGYLPMLLEHHWSEILENSRKFIEFEEEFDAQKNGENLMFLEEHKETYGNAFENIYHSHYAKIIGKLGECIQNYSLTADMLLKIFYDDLCGLLAELFNFVKNCTSDYCFSLMKNKTQIAKSSRNSVQPQNMNGPAGNVKGQDILMAGNELFEFNGSDPERVQAQQKQQSSLPNFLNWKNSNLEENKGEFNQAENQRNMQSMSTDNLETLAHLIDFNVGRRDDQLENRNFNGLNNSKAMELVNAAPSENESVASDNLKKLQRKYWSAAELQELENLSIQYHPNSIPIDRLEEFARKYGRTLNAVQSKISKTKKEKAKKNSDILQGNMPAPASRSEAQRKYEVSVDKMIKGALQQFPGNTATKIEIIGKIKEMFFRGDIQVNDDKLRNSISQTLSSSKGIAKIKGIYSLRSQAFLVTDISTAKTMKSRLQYILSKSPGLQANITTIRKLYWDCFSETVDAEGVWETSITKILKQSHEFDTSNSKTKYCLCNPDLQD